MSLQKMLDVQRYLKETQPDLRAGSHDWWVAFRAELKEGRRNEGKEGEASSRG